MPYDFETSVDRSDMGSEKWELMYATDPAVPPGIVPFSVGDMELKPPPELVDGLREFLDVAVLGYTSQTAADRRAAVDWFKRRHQWEVSPDSIVSVDGVVPALYLAVRTFTEPGEGVIYMPPVYHPIYRAIEVTGRQPVGVPLVVGENGYCIDFESFEEAASSPTVAMLLLCSPHNPVARVWTRDELREIGRICKKYEVMVVSDEIHFDFAMPGHVHTVFSEVDPAFRDMSIICTAPSKSFNIAGLQVSNLVIPNEKICRAFIAARHHEGREYANQVGLAACRIVYERCEAWLDEVVRLIHENGLLVRDFMAEHYPEVTVHRHEGTFFVWLDFRKWGKAPRDLARFMTMEARLFLDEGSIFGCDGDGFERINIACPRWVLRAGLERLLKAGRP
ncbi:MAG: pyridoxal phosphate-dependent aminotransferase [Planctomycetes bacterium]|nr:pyridoxal phosphate-dependent aminotransferase [Planctomycetota bacterium]